MRKRKYNSVRPQLVLQHQRLLISRPIAATIVASDKLAKTALRNTFSESEKCS